VFGEHATTHRGTRIQTFAQGLGVQKSLVDSNEKITRHWTFGELPRARDGCNHRNPACRPDQRIITGAES